DSGDVDAVVTAVPHFDHPELTITAIGKGIHTLTEKPAGIYTTQVEEMNSLAAEHPETTCAIMFHQRTKPVYTDLQALIDSSDLGRRRGRGAGEPGTPAAGPVAVAGRDPEEGLRQARLRIPARYRHRGRGQRHRRFRRGRDRAFHDLHQ